MTLYIKHRPQSFDKFVGNEEVVEALKKILERPIEKIPHVYLFEGDYGTGKTTLARILAKELGCAHSEMHLVDAGTHRKVESADKIKEHMIYLPISGKIKVYIIDEIQTTKGSKFQESLLNTLEDGCPKHVFFFFCTTDAHKVNRGIINRSIMFHLRKYSIRELIKIQENILDDEYQNYEELVNRNILRKIAMKADGSPREAITLLEKVVGIVDVSNIDELIDTLDVEKDGLEIVKALLNKNSWKFITDKLKKTKNTPDEILHTINNYCTGILLKSENPKKEKAYDILTCFIEEETITRNKLIYLLSYLY